MTFYVTFNPVTVCKCHIELKATWLNLTLQPWNINTTQPTLLITRSVLSG